MKKAIFIVGSKRTAFGAYGGKLLSHTCTDIGEIAAKGALENAKIAPELIDSVIYGNVCQSNNDTAYLSRHVGLRVGVKQSTPCLTVNRLCGSSFQSIINGCHELLLGESEIALVGGSENMSEVPFSVRNVRFGTKFTVDYKFEDTLWATLTDNYTKLPMALTAEKLAEKCNISRGESDEFALRSQELWKKAYDRGIFRENIIPIQIKGKKGQQEIFDVDEHPRITSMDILSKLPSLFKKNGVVTAGNASGVSDGAAALILATEDAVKKHNLTPHSRIIGYQVVGCDPTIMGIGPVAAITKLLSKMKCSLNDIDYFDINEAFAAQTLACQKELKIPLEKLNVHGGAIAIGHPVGASGARIISHLSHCLHNGFFSEMKSGKVIGSACIGGGQGIAVALQKI